MSAAVYGTGARRLHWVVALLIAVALPSGFLLDATGAQGAGLLVLHLAAGAAVALLTLVRAGWWLLIETPLPALPGPFWQRGLARLVRGVFYLLPLVLAASGIGMMVLSGAAAVLPGGPLPDFDQFLPRIPHGLAARLLIAAILLHLAGVMFHRFVLRDGLLRRML